MLQQDHIERMENWPLGNFLSHKQESPRNPNMSDSFFLEFQNVVYYESDDNFENGENEVFVHGHVYSNYNEEDVNNANEEIVAQGLQKLGHAASDKVKRGNSSKTALFCNHPTQN